jgi:hypothetical protein
LIRSTPLNVHGISRIIQEHTLVKIPGFIRMASGIKTHLHSVAKHMKYTALVLAVDPSAVEGNTVAWEEGN